MHPRDPGISMPETSSPPGHYIPLDLIIKCRRKAPMGKLILIRLVLFNPLSALAEKHYCHDPESNAEWEELIH